MIPSWVKRELEDLLIQWMLTQSILLHLVREKGKGSSSPRDCCLRAVETIFKETAMFTSPHAKAMAISANRASQGPRVRAKERKKKVKETVHRKSKGSKSAEGSYNGQSSC